jgi:hypothetical protein
MTTPETIHLSTTPHSTRSSHIQFSHHIQTTLTQENFLVWKFQNLPILRGHGLISFINGTTHQPFQTVTDAVGAQSINPDFQHWHQQDQLILAWIFDFISPSLLSQLVQCETLAQFWSAITQLHSSQSMA